MLITTDNIVSIRNKIQAAGNLVEDMLMQEVVEITSQELNLDLVGIFLFSANAQTAFLRAGSGERGKYMVGRKHKISLNESSIFMNVAKNEIRVFDGWSGKIYGCLVPDVIQFKDKLPIHLLSEGEILHSQNAPSYTSVEFPSPFWEIALPLRANNQVVGSLWIQILELSKFTLDDCLNLQWLVDQLSKILFKSLE